MLQLRLSGVDPVPEIADTLGTLKLHPSEIPDTVGTLVLHPSDMVFQK